MSDSVDHTAWRERLDLELEGALTHDERWRLDEHLAGCAECRRERHELHQLQDLLGEARIPVHGELRRSVMESLPAAGWEARAPQAWRLPVLLLVLLGGSAAALVGVSSAQLTPRGPFVGALLAVGDLFRAALVAGAGLLAASWRGVGMALGEVFATSTGTVVASIVLVVCLDLLLILLLRGRTRSPAAAGRELRSSERDGRHS